MVTYRLYLFHNFLSVGLWWKLTRTRGTIFQFVSYQTAEVFLFLKRLKWAVVDLEIPMCHWNMVESYKTDRNIVFVLTSIICPTIFTILNNRSGIPLVNYQRQKWFVFIYSRILDISIMCQLHFQNVSSMERNRFLIQAKQSAYWKEISILVYFGKCF